MLFYPFLWRMIMSNLIQAAESHYKSLMDKYALCLNACMGSDQPDLDKFLGSVEQYEQALAQFNVIQTIKSQMVADPESELAESENNEG